MKSGFIAYMLTLYASISRPLLPHLGTMSGYIKDIAAPKFIVAELDEKNQIREC